MEPVIIALAGKGGVGKTSLSALVVKILTEKYPEKKIHQRITADESFLLQNL